MVSQLQLPKIIKIFAVGRMTKTIKLWKVFEKKVKHISNFNLQGGHGEDGGVGIPAAVLNPDVAGKPIDWKIQFETSTGCPG